MIGSLFCLHQSVRVPITLGWIDRVDDHGEI